MFIIRVLLTLIVEAVVWVLFRLRIISGDKVEALHKPIYLNLTFPKHTVLVLIVIIVIAFSIVTWALLTEQ